MTIKTHRIFIVFGRSEILWGWYATAVWQHILQAWQRFPPTTAKRTMAGFHIVHQVQIAHLVIRSGTWI